METDWCHDKVELKHVLKFAKSAMFIIYIYYKGILLYNSMYKYIYMIDLSWCKLEDSNPLFSPDASQAFIGFHKFVSVFCTRSCIVLSRCASPKDLDMSLHRRVSQPTFVLLWHPLSSFGMYHWCLSAWPCPAYRPITCRIMKIATADGRC